ncbi:sialoadhesin-like isoform X2 [Esox lucius]|uniref:sialoadhesin-like isoform X2 n=1 Tax=Esox lucius TaxID=8010 RepID=UPI0009732FCB|nr:sialoadhesin-like isoform X2 [Esox lucius]
MACVAVSEKIITENYHKILLFFRLFERVGQWKKKTLVRFLIVYHNNSTPVRMNFLSVSALLGITVLMIQNTDSEGSTIFLKECVTLRCSVGAGANLSWTYQWFRDEVQKRGTPNARHLVIGDSYFITAVARADSGSYWCQAERNGSNTHLLSNRVHLTVSEWMPPLLSVIPSSRQHFQGNSFSLQCPAVSGSNSKKSNSTNWTLQKLTDFDARPGCQAQEGTLRDKVPGACSFPSPDGGVSGLYWCQSGKRRSNSVTITVSSPTDGTVIIMVPAHPVSEGDSVHLHCRFWIHKPIKTTFYKDGVEICSLNVTEMVIDNVTSADEGLYKCADPEDKSESPESWLAVRSHLTSDDGKPLQTEGTWKWVVPSSCILGILLVILLILIMVCHFRRRMWCTRSCLSSKEGAPPVEAPKTKQDGTEVQWDLAWMEMANLLDKQQYPATVS